MVVGAALGLSEKDCDGLTSEELIQRRSVAHHGIRDAVESRGLFWNGRPWVDVTPRRSHRFAALESHEAHLNRAIAAWNLAGGFGVEKADRHLIPLLVEEPNHDCLANPVSQPPLLATSPLISWSSREKNSTAPS